jgi:heme/copper-type cytochrome/quinol oxidase subunit 2
MNHRSTFVLPCAALLFLSPAAVPRAADLPAHECTVTANQFQYSPSRLEAHEGEIVRIAFHAVDLPHTFTIDAYRISKRAAKGQTIVFEFRADRVGTFPIYCNLTADERNRRMKGEFVVSP